MRSAYPARPWFMVSIMLGRSDDLGGLPHVFAAIAGERVPARGRGRGGARLEFGGEEGHQLVPGLRAEGV